MPGRPRKVTADERFKTIGKVEFGDMQLDCMCYITDPRNFVGDHINLELIEIPKLYLSVLEVPEYYAEKEVTEILYLGSYESAKARASGQVTAKTFEKSYSGQLQLIAVATQLISFTFSNIFKHLTLPISKYGFVTWVWIGIKSQVNGTIN